MSRAESEGGALRIDVSNYSSGFSLSNRLGRLAWGFAWAVLFRWSPRPAMGWRRGLLRLFGAKIGKGASIYPDVRVWAPWNLVMEDHSCLGPGANCYCVAPIHLGAHATVSQFAFLCSAGHDIQDPGMRLQVAPIVVERGAWICAGAFVGPGITVGEYGVLAAMGCLTKHLPAEEVWGGNPARFIKQRNLKVGSPG